MILIQNFKKMDKTLILLSIEQLFSKFQKLEEKINIIENNLKSLETPKKQQTTTSPIKDQLIDTKEVLKMLGICYNTLQSIIRKKLISPIKISPRRVRYSQKAILTYIEKQKSD